MRFVRVLTFALVLLFSCCLVSQVGYTATATHVSKDVYVTNGQVPISGSDNWKGFLGDTEAAGAATGMGVAGAAFAAAGVMALVPGVGWIGAGVAALVGGIAAAWTTYHLTHEAPICSFYTILSSFSSLNHGSWLSPVFNMIFNAINELAVAVNSGTLSDWVVKILALMMAFYLMYVATKYIVSFTPIEPAKMLSEIFFPLGRMLIAVILIKEWNYVFHDLLSPVLDLGINFGAEIMNTMGNMTLSYSASVDQSPQLIGAVCSGTEGAGLSISVCNSIQTFLATISSNLMVWMAFGATLIVDSWSPSDIFPSLRMIILGLILFVFTFMVYIAFPLKLIDAMFRLMFIVVLFPLWCMFWVIPYTREYFKKMIGLLINVIATFLSSSVILIMVLAILSNLFEAIPLRQIIDLLEDDKSDEALELIGFSTSSLFYSICLLFMAFHLVGKVDYFANLFSKQEDMKIGSTLGAKTTAAVTAAAPWAFRNTANVAKWGAGKAKGAWESHKAKDYNAGVPGGTARKSPRLWTAAIPGMGLWDAHKAKSQIGSYQRTQDVQVTPLEKAKDGSTSQTYSNKTVDKKGNVMAQMSETTTSSGNKVKINGKKVDAKQSVERTRTSFDDAGDVRRNTKVKKDFENGKAVRKTTTNFNKDGSRTELSVDKKTGLATKTRFGADGKKLSSETRDRLGNRTVSNYDANGRLTEENTHHRDGTSTRTIHGADGSIQKEIKDAQGTVRGISTNRADGSSQTIRYSKERLADGQTPANFERVNKDASGKKTEHLRVDLKNDSFKDMLTGATGKWSTHNKTP